jgi:hypothetical protein
MSSTDEENGREYNFVSKAVFEYLIDQGLIQEWGTLNNHYYGTLNAPARITPASASGKPAPFLRSKTMLVCYLPCSGLYLVITSILSV